MPDFVTNSTGPEAVVAEAAAVVELSGADEAASFGFSQPVKASTAPTIKSEEALRTEFTSSLLMISA
jgi:hypothetical protein